MSTRATRKSRRRLGVLATVIGAFGVFLAVAGTASAAVSCSFSAATAQLTIIVSDGGLTTAGGDNTVTVTRGIADSILVNGTNCVDAATLSTATTLNTRQINVLPSATTGADGNDTLIIDERQGRFVPGAPGADTTAFDDGTFVPGLSDGNGLNEIEWWVELGGARPATTGNQITFFDVNTEGAVVVGSDGSPTTAGAGGTYWDGTAPIAPGGTFTPGPSEFGDVLINLNAFPGDDDADVYAPIPGTGNSLGSININMGEGDNYVSGKGGDGTGAASSCPDPVTGTVPTPIPLVITAGGGADSLTGGCAIDFISAGGGNNFIDGNLPFVSDITSFQNDLLARWGLGSFSGDFLDLSGSAGPLTLTINPDGSVSGAGSVVLGIEGLAGSAGNDTITGDSNPNLLIGGGGDDTIHGGNEPAGSPGDFIDGDNCGGLFTLTSSGTAGNDTLDGGQGDDTIVGCAGDDTINENTGVTSAGFQNGADAIDGGEGTDTVLYDERTTRVVVYLGLISTFNDGADTNADGLTNEFDDVFFTTENVKTGSGEDLISANFVNNRSNNVFTDNGGNDCVEGGPGNDQFIQSAAPQGADVVIGNTGADTADYSSRTAAVAVSLDGVANDGDIVTNEGDNVGGFSVSCRPQTVVVNPPLSVVSLNAAGSSFVVTNDLNFLDAPVAGPAPNCFGIFFDEVFDCDPGETLGGDQAPLVNVDVENINGGAGDDELVGNAVGNVLNGNAGNDRLSGNAATDQLNGGEGDDILSPGAGNDQVNGGEGTNTVDYSDSTSAVQVNLTTNVASGAGNDTFTGGTIQNVNGSPLGDVIAGNELDNILNGNQGNDAISGNAGNDTLNGGAGADQMSGQTGADKISGAEGNDAIQGGADNDWLQGGQGRDTILGQKGNDRLYGNAQPDFLNGGRGSDVCKPGSPGLARGDVVVNCER